MRLRIDLAYDGGPFLGFARQPGHVTVQGVLEDALSMVFQHDVATTCAGRTDKGVHALAQVVHADVVPHTPRGHAVLADLPSLRHRLDRIAGDAITVWQVTEVDEGFDARFAAEWRFYRYRMSSRPADPRVRNVVWHVGGRLDVPAMQLALAAVVGEHDYHSFCRASEGRTTKRSVLEAAVTPAGPEIHVTVRGTAFCHQMVRAITGSLVEVGRGRQDPAWLGRVLAARDRSVAGPVAPPQGLTLEAVGYADPYEDAPPVGEWSRPVPDVVHADRADTSPG